MGEIHLLKYVYLADLAHAAAHAGESFPGVSITTARRAVQDYGNDTPALLHAVYSTAPMLEAAPGENLSLTAAAPEPAPEGVAPSVQPLRPLSKTHLKKLRQRVEERLEEIRRRESERAARRPRPIYDEVFFAGRDWLEGLAGAPIEEEEGEVCVDDEVWHSLARREPKLP